MKIIDASQEDLQLLASCVYSSKMAAMNELAAQSKISNPNPQQIERTGKLGELVQFCDRFLRGVNMATMEPNPALDMANKFKPGQS